MRFWQLVAVLCFAAILSSCGGGSGSIDTPAPPNGPKPPSTSPTLSFPYEGGWLGADAAYSVDLGGGKSVWIFGDTFVGSSTETLRSRNTGMPRNSIGLSQCSAAGCTMQYYWKGQGTVVPKSFFDAGALTWYWPMDGFMHNGVLYLALSELRSTGGTGVFAFEFTGAKLITISNPTASPDQWNIQVQTLATGAQLIPGVSIVLDGDYAVFFTLVSPEAGGSHMTLARVLRNNLGNVAANWQYLGTDNAWHAGLYAADARTVIDTGSTEGTVRYHSSINKWIQVTSGPEFLSNRAVYRMADNYQGPWSAPQTLYQYPEMKLGDPTYDSENFCYAAKEHVEFSDSSKITLTYACNSFSWSKLIADMRIYRPQVVTLNVPQP